MAEALAVAPMIRKTQDQHANQSLCGITMRVQLQERQWCDSSFVRLNAQ
jgi:hypothetical protein